MIRMLGLGRLSCSAGAGQCWVQDLMVLCLLGVASRRVRASAMPRRFVSSLVWSIQRRSTHKVGAQSPPVRCCPKKKTTKKPELPERLKTFKRWNLALEDMSGVGCAKLTVHLVQVNLFSSMAARQACLCRISSLALNLKLQSVKS